MRLPPAHLLHQYITGHLIWLVLVFLLFPKLFAQADSPQRNGEEGFNPRFEVFKLPGGTLGNNVNCILQDSIGFLWFASQGGLHRYDGHRFRTYTHDPDDTGSLSFSNIEWLCQGREGKLWVGTYGGGLNCFDPASESAIRYRHDPNDSLSLSNDYVSMMAIDREGLVWVGTNRGLNRLNPTTGRFDRFLHKADDSTSLSDDMVRAVYIDRAGTLWAGTGSPWENDNKGGLNRYKPEQNTFTRFIHEPERGESLRDNRIRVIFEDSRGNFWVGTVGNNLHLMDREAGTFTWLDKNENGISFAPVTNRVPEHSGSPQLSFVFEDQQKRIWIGSIWGGLNLYYPESGKIRHFEYQKDSPLQPANNFIWNMCQSSDGCLWLATAGGGHQVFKLFKEERYFEFYAMDSIGDNPFSSIITDIEAVGEDRVYISTFSGRFYQYIPSEGQWKHLPQLEKVKRIARDQEGIIWLLKSVSEDESNSINLTRFSPITEDTLHYQIRNLQAPLQQQSFGIYFRDLSVDQEGRLWIPYSGGGLVCFDPKTGESRHFLHHPLDTHSLSNDAVLTVFVDQQGQVWAGGGVFAYSKASNCFLDRYAPVADVFRHYELPPTFRNAAIFAITEDNKGRIWFALDNAGLGCLDPSSGRVNLFNSSNKKLPLDNFHGLQADQKGRLWFSTSQAVGYFNPQTDSYRLFELDEKEEMPHFMSKSTQSEKGAFFWTSLRGFYHFDTGKMDQNSQDKVPDILLTDFLIYHQPQLAGGNSPMQEPVWSTDKIHARYSDELFTFHFASLDFRYPESNQYQYKLDPYDPYWRQTETEQSATYIHVPPGQYTFRVRTANREGFWSPEKRVQIFISSPWWQRWWAYALLAFSIGGLIISIYRIRLRRALDQAEAYRLKELDTIKSRLYTNITHEFRTPLMIILGMAREILDHPDKHFRGGLKMIMQNGRKLLHLVNQLLDLSKLDQGRMKLRLQQGDIISYLRYLVDSYQTYAKSKKVQLHFLPQKEKLLMDFDPEKLQKIVGNLIANALKFTPENGHIYLFVDQGMRKEGEYLQIKVKDTGPGIRPEALPFIFDRFYQGDFEKNQVQETSQPGTGIGLALVRELVALMGGEVRVESQYGNGAEFIISLPVAQNSKDQVSMEDKTIAPLPNDTETNSAGESHSKGGAPLILIVEDNPDVINLLTIILSPLYSLKIARNGKEGLEQSIEKTPDLILADIRMPVMNGLDLCLRLKNDERTSHIPIIILTARGDISGKLSALEMGADAYLVKPFHREELLIRVKMLLELRKKLQRHFLDVSGLGEKNTFTEEPEKFAEAENRFVRKIIQIVEDHLDDFDFSVDRLCREATLSNSQLNRKLVALTGLSASRFIRHIRLSKAKDLLLEKDASVTTVAFDTGFQDPSYFGRVFKKAFGVTPLEWRENNIGQEIKP